MSLISEEQLPSLMVEEELERMLDQDSIEVVASEGTGGGRTPILKVDIVALNPFAEPLSPTLSSLLWPEDNLLRKQYTKTNYMEDTIIQPTPNFSKVKENRAAQRTFGERQKRSMKELGTKIGDLKSVSESANNHILLSAQVDGLQSELKEYRKRLFLHNGHVNRRSPPRILTVFSDGPFTRNDPWTTTFVRAGSRLDAWPHANLFGDFSLAIGAHSLVLYQWSIAFRLFENRSEYLCLRFKNRIWVPDYVKLHNQYHRSDKFLEAAKDFRVTDGPGKREDTHGLTASNLLRDHCERKPAYSGFMHARALKILQSHLELLRILEVVLLGCLLCESLWPKGMGMRITNYMLLVSFFLYFVQQKMLQQIVWKAHLAMWLQSTIPSTLRWYCIKLIESLHLLDPPVQAGKKRICWTCRCGHRSFDDFEELHPGAVKRYEIQLQEYLKASANQAGPATSSMISRGIHSMSSLFGRVRNNNQNNGSGNNGHSLPMFNSVYQPEYRTPPPGVASPDSLYLLLCIPHRKYATRLFQPNLQEIRSDKDFFNLLKTNYHSLRGRLGSVLSLKTLKAIRFVQFEMYRSELVDIRKENDIPPESRKHEYRYQPIPAEIVPPVGERHMMHLYSHPEDADDVDTFCLNRIPKKLKHRLFVCPTKGTGLGWGIHFIEDWHYNQIRRLAFFLLIVASLVFLICWAVLEHDIQGASSVAGYMLTFVTLFLVGLQAFFEHN